MLVTEFLKLLRGSDTRSAVSLRMRPDVLTLLEGRSLSLTRSDEGGPLAACHIRATNMRSGGGLSSRRVGARYTLTSVNVYRCRWAKGANLP